MLTGTQLACQLVDNFNWDSIMSDDIELSSVSWKQWRTSNLCLLCLKQYPAGFYPPERNLPWLNKSIIRLNKSIICSMKKRKQLFKQLGQRSGNFGQLKLAWNRTVTGKETE